MYETILVPIDGSDSSNRAIEHALEIAEQFDTTLHALFVVDTRMYGEPSLSSTEIVVDELEDHGHALVDELADRADNLGIDTATRVCHGVPHDEIISYADEVDADTIVMGYQGQTHRQKSVASSNASSGTAVGRSSPSDRSHSGPITSATLSVMSSSARQRYRLA